MTPHCEAFQAVVWHLFVSHPDLKVNQTKWEIGGAGEALKDARHRRGVPAVFLRSGRDAERGRWSAGGEPFSPHDGRRISTASRGCRKHAGRSTDAGFVLVVATNQPDVGRGKAAAGDGRGDARETAHAASRDRSDRGLLRPRPGRVLAAQEAGAGNAAGRGRASCGLDLARSWMIGDRWRDIDCGQPRGRAHRLHRPGLPEELRSVPDLVVKSFGEAVAAVLARARSNPSSSARPPGEPIS